MIAAFLLFVSLTSCQNLKKDMLAGITKLDGVYELQEDTYDQFINWNNDVFVAYLIDIETEQSVYVKE